MEGKGKGGRQKRIMQDASDDETNEVHITECYFHVDCVFPIHHADGVDDYAPNHTVVSELHSITRWSNQWRHVKYRSWTASNSSSPMVTRMVRFNYSLFKAFSLQSVTEVTNRLYAHT